MGLRHCTQSRWDTKWTLSLDFSFLYSMTGMGASKPRDLFCHSKRTLWMPEQGLGTRWAKRTRQQVDKQHTE